MQGKNLCLEDIDLRVHLVQGKDLCLEDIDLWVHLVMGKDQHSKGIVLLDTVLDLEGIDLEDTVLCWGLAWRENMVQMEDNSKIVQNVELYRLI